jgi:hypothetical protein
MLETNYRVLVAEASEGLLTPNEMTTRLMCERA